MPDGSEEARLHAVAIFIQSDDPTKQPRPRPQTDILIDIGGAVSKALFCGDDDRPYAVITDRSRGVAYRSLNGLRNGCEVVISNSSAKARIRNSVRGAIETISAKAQFSGERRKVFLRTAEDNGKFYVDLTDDAWRVVEVTAHGWRILDDSPVMFTRRGAPAPLPVPKAGGTIQKLWNFLNVKESDRPLIAGWLLTALSPRGPYPVLVLHGEEGTAKSTTARMLRSLCDPSLVPLRAPTKDERDFLVGAVGNWCVVIDNLSGLQPWLSDAVCRLSTGGGFTARTLYTDCDETVVPIKRPVILNGIDEFAVRGDLVSRSIVLQLELIEESKRCEESALWEQFEIARPGIFGTLLTAFSAAVRKVDSVELTRRPRMVDFAKWTTAAEVELGFEPGEFLEAYMGNLHDSALATLESSPVAQALIVFISERREWTGTATELLKSIAPLPDGKPSADVWPKKGRGMMSELNRLAPALRRIQIRIDRLKRSDAQGTRRIRLTCNLPAQPSEPSEPSEATWDAGFRADGSERSDRSTVSEPGDRQRPSEKNVNKINATDGSDGSDGSAGTLNGRKRTVVL